jgi:hypothetical protein
MVDRRLILTLEGAPLCWGLTQGDIRKRINDYPDDDVDLLQVWEVPSHGSYAIAEDISKRFAFDWSKEFEYGDGIEPSDYLARFPAFVRSAARERLIKEWEAALAKRDGDFIPNFVRRAG